MTHKTIVIIGDSNGGIGLGRSSNYNLNLSVFKALNNAKKNFFKISLKNNTLPCSILGKSCKCYVYLSPLKNIFNFSSGSYVRSVLELMGIYNVTSKIYGSGNFYNIINAVFNALFFFKININKLK